MATVAQPPDSAADHCPTCRKPWVYCFCGQPRPNGPRFRSPHPSRHMTPGRFAWWCASLELAAAERGLPPEPWPMP